MHCQDGSVVGHRSSPRLANTRWFHNLRFNSIWLFALLGLMGASGVQAQVDHGTAQEVRTLYPSEWNTPYPAGVAYATQLDWLFLLDNGSNPVAGHSSRSLVILTPYEDLVATVPLTFRVDNAINIAYDDAHHRLLLLNNQRARLAQVTFGDNETPEPATIRIDIAHLALGTAAGMAVDPVGMRLFILDSEALQIVSADLSDGYALVSKIDLKQLGHSGLRGLAVHPTSYNLFVMSPRDDTLYELTQLGQLVQRYDLAFLELVDARGLAFAASADMTDAPETIHLYLADSNLPDASTVNRHQILWPYNLYSRESATWLATYGEKGQRGNQVRSGRSEIRPIFGRIVEIVLTPGAGTIEPCGVACQGEVPNSCVITGNQNFQCGGCSVDR